MMLISLMTRTRHSTRKSNAHSISILSRLDKISKEALPYDNILVQVSELTGRSAQCWSRRSFSIVTIMHALYYIRITPSSSYVYYHVYYCNLILFLFFRITYECNSVSVFLISIILRYQILLVTYLCAPRPPFEFDLQPIVRISSGIVRASNSTCECMDISLTYCLTRLISHLLSLRRNDMRVIYKIHVSMIVAIAMMRMMI